MFTILIAILNIYSFILLVRVLMTWIPNLPYENPIVKFLFQITEPILQPIREALPKQTGVDFSPIVVFVAIMIITRVLASF